MSTVRVAAPIWLLCLLYSVIISCFLQKAQVAAVTDPNEVLAIGSLAEKCNISSSKTWNVSDPCSGAAISTADIGNPGIRCDCTGDTCHVTKMKAYALNLTGEIPEELANLTLLTDLDLGLNYFTGPLTVLGNLTNMQYLYIDSAGISGEIPSTFRNLQKLQILWASDNQLTGEIPDFIGSWTDLTQLRLHGTSLKGPIPSSFSNLTSLTTLRISDLTSGFSSLEFLRNLQNLTELVLRNNMISGEIPSYIGEFRQLQILDLSFNNFTGEIPDSLLNSSSLQYLFLGNNRLSGNLPSQKNSSLRYVDLSYNHFSGGLPKWLSNGSLELNLVGNYLEFNETDNALASKGLSCLQRTFPCNRGTPRYSHFAINCGGQQMTSAKEIVYESDNKALDAASFYVSDTQNWGVSNIGKFMDNTDPTYIQTSQSQFTNTLDPELYQTVRLSPSSLRYYGLGLENGTYTVNLQFAEIESPDTETWKSFGRRIFDVYVQGNKVLTDFNIRQEAGSSNKAVQRSFRANVTEKFLEIHFFWTGKGTCCIPNQGHYGPLVSAISVTPEFTPTVTDITPSNTPGKNIKTRAVIGIVFGGMAAVLTCIAFIIFKCRRVQKASETSGEEYEALKGMHAKPSIFSYADMKTATTDFHEQNKLGQGGFGTVYKGILPDGKDVAVKQLSAESKQGKREFINEVAAISAVQHRNLVKLHGCCLEGEQRLLVYEYLENNSLAQALFDKKSNIQLDWPIRYNICVGTARGLAYLHEESSIRIVHRDIKPSNILLDNSLNPKIADFGLAKLYDDTETHISTRVAGTVGYLAPEYAMRGHLTEKADVFSFGVVALEVVSGRSNTEASLPEERVYLLEWAWHLHEKNQLLDLMDSRLISTYSDEEVMRVILVGLLCTQASPAMRPSMSRVVVMLTSDVEEIPVASRPGYITDWQYKNSAYKSSALSPKDNSTDIILPTAPFSPESALSPKLSSKEIILHPAPFSPEIAEATPSMIHRALGEGR